MLAITHITQPGGAATYLGLLDQGLVGGQYTNLDVAIAYATEAGVREILSLNSDWTRLPSRWLVGIDWCRSEPLALELLASMPRATVRIHDGQVVVGRSGCAPRLPFHPKTFIARGPDALGVLTGSGNLSRNGLTGGHEAGTLTVVSSPRSANDVAVWESSMAVKTWFDTLWRAATPLQQVMTDYRTRFESAARLSWPTPVDDDASDPPPVRGLSADDLKQLRACRFLWIQAGNLGLNRGYGHPGNQLMLSPMTRVFFGFPATVVPRDTLIGHVAVEFAGHTRPDCSLRFSNNSMDVLTLPIPGQGGPAAYDQSTLLFEKRPTPRSRHFDLAIATGGDANQWERRSVAVGGRHVMTSGRKWGVF